MTPLAAWLASGLALRLLNRHNILAHPDRRSSHILPTPHGGGIAVVGVTSLGWIAIGALGIGDWSSLATVLAAALVLAIVSWFDDVGSLPVTPRFVSQVVAITIVMLLAPMETLTHGLLPLPFDRLLSGILWIWFINLFNFMDGIDGIAGVETLCLCLGVIGVASIANSGENLILPATILGAAMVGFLPWNWHRATLFLGDVGSVPVGFMLGWFLLQLAGHGQWAAALVLPSYYIADATLTLFGRAIRGEVFWKPHRGHFYQRAVAGGLSHGQASKAVAAAGMWLLGCAFLSAISHTLVLFSLLGATLGVASLLWYFQRVAHSTPPTV